MTAEQLQSVYETERSLVESLRANRMLQYRTPAQFQEQPEVCTESGRQLRPARPGAFTRLAELLRREKIEPVSYIRFHLQVCLLAPRLPTPVDLTRPSAVQRYRLAQQRWSGQISRSLLHHVQLVQQELVCRRLHDASQSLDQCLASILYDTQLELSALFRYCYAYAQRQRPLFASICRHFAPAARQQLHSRGTAIYVQYYEPLFPGAVASLLPPTPTPQDEPNHDS